MSDSHNYELDAYRARHREVRPSFDPEHAASNDQEAVSASLYLLDHPGLGLRPNASLRAATMHSAQRTYGNCAVQRSLGRVPVQRSFWEDAAGILGGPLVRYALDPDKEKAQERRMSGTVQDEQKKYEKSIDWAEGAAGGFLHDAANTVKDVPVIGGIAGSAANIGEQAIQFNAGAMKATANMVGGLASMALNPIDTAKGLGEMGRHLPFVPGVGLPNKLVGNGIDVLTGNKTPGEAFDQAVGPKGVNEDLNFWSGMAGHFLAPYGEAASKGRYAEIGGRAAVDIGSFILGLGEEGQASKGARGARAAGEGGEGGSVAGKVAGDGAPPTLRSPKMPEGVPDGPPTIPDPPGSLPPSTRRSPRPWYQPVGFDRPLEPYVEPGPPRKPIGFDRWPDIDPPPSTRRNPLGLEPGAPMRRPMRRPIGFGRELEPIVPHNPNRKPIGFDRPPDTQPIPDGPLTDPSPPPFRRPIGFDRPLEPVAPKGPVRKPIGFEPRWPSDWPGPPTLPAGWALDLFGA